MPIYKVNYFFTQRKNGWSETWYLDKATAAVALEAAQEPLSRRVRMLGGSGPTDETGPYLAAIRVSNIAIQRDSLVYVVPLSDGRATNPLGTAENPNLAILLRIEGGDLYRRNLYVRGYPDIVSDLNGLYVPTAAWARELSTWASFMVLRSFGILATSKTAFPPLTIVGMSVIGVGEVVLTFAAPHGYSSGDSVRVVSAPGTTGVRGIWRIAVVDALNFRLMGSNSPLVATTYLGGGTVYKRTNILVPVTTIQAERLTHRVTGRPFDSPVGSRRRRVPA